MGRSSHTNTSQIWAAARRGGAASRPRRRLRADFEGPVVRLAALLGAAGFGALAEYFFLDRQHAARRRHTARDRARASVRRGARESVRRAKYLEGVAEGIAHRTGHALPGAGGPRE